MPPQYRDPDGRWVGVTGRARVIAYGSQVAESELPDSPLGLTDPRVEGPGRLGPASDSLQQYVTALRLEYGDDVAREWLEGMVANDAVDYPDNVSIRDAIATGEIDVGLINHYYVAQAIAAEGPDYPVEALLPAEGPRLAAAADPASACSSPPSARRRRSTSSARCSPRRARSSSPRPRRSIRSRSARSRIPRSTCRSTEIPVPTGNLSDISETQATIELMQEAGAL